MTKCIEVENEELCLNRMVKEFNTEFTTFTESDDSEFFDIICNNERDNYYND
jgi:hypothetical protein